MQSLVDVLSPAVSTPQMQLVPASGGYAEECSTVIAQAVAEAWAVGAADPLVYVGLRLLQHGERAIQLPPPPADGAGAAAPTSALALTGEAAVAQLSEAEEELAELRRELQRVELAEAAKAMQLILRARGVEGPPTDLEFWCFHDAATVVQAGFHGMLARRWVGEQRRRLSAPTSDEAAAAIQAGFHGMVARRWTEELRSASRNNPIYAQTYMSDL